MATLVALVAGLIDFGRITAGGTRSVIFVAVALVLAMLVASGCRTGEDEANAKTEHTPRNKTTR